MPDSMYAAPVIPGPDGATRPTPTPENLINRSISFAEMMEFTATTELKKLTVEDTNWDAYVQIAKDNRKFIAEQLHTLSLIETGSI